MSKRKYGSRFYFWITVFLTIFLTLAGTIIFHYVEYGLNSEVTNWQDSLWWVISTITTTGAPDITPVTSIGRWIGMLLMSFGLLAISIIAAALATKWVGRK